MSALSITFGVPLLGRSEGRHFAAEKWAVLSNS